jgi:hypothetical protein
LDKPFYWVARDEVQLSGQCRDLAYLPSRDHGRVVTVSMQLPHMLDSAMFRDGSVLGFFIVQPQRS